MIPKKILFAVYGTLKKERGNHGFLSDEGVDFKGNYKTPPNYTMVSCGGFPAVHCEGNTSIVTELYEVTNQDVIKNVFSLEGYSGTQGSSRNWYDVEEIDTPYGKASMFVFRGKIQRPVVETGNW